MKDLILQTIKEFSSAGLFAGYIQKNKNIFYMINTKQLADAIYKKITEFQDSEQLIIKGTTTTKEE